jgi:hypothetical protein
MLTYADVCWVDDQGRKFDPEVYIHSYHQATSVRGLKLLVYAALSY